MDWPSDRVERRPIASLLPYAQNPRMYSGDNLYTSTTGNGRAGES